MRSLACPFRPRGLVDGPLATLPSHVPWLSLERDGLRRFTSVLDREDARVTAERRAGYIGHVGYIDVKARPSASDPPSWQHHFGKC
jgi:hypothetical protein